MRHPRRYRRLLLSLILSGLVVSDAVAWRRDPAPSTESVQVRKSGNGSEASAGVDSNPVFQSS
jgi:hypothetical protein